MMPDKKLDSLFGGPGIGLTENANPERDRRLKFCINSNRAEDPPEFPHLFMRRNGRRPAVLHIGFLCLPYSVTNLL